MPMIDACIPKGALTAKAEERLLQELTELLVRVEGFDPANARPRAATWIFVHRPEVFVAGFRTATPRYRFVVMVPEGKYNDEARAAVVKEVTGAVARAEGASLDDVRRRVWVFPTELPDGQWGSRGEIRRLPDIVEFLVGEQERAAAEQTIADRRRTTALAILDAANTPAAT